MRELNLPEGLVTSLASGHPWVYRDHVGKFHAPSGSWVRVRAGSFVAYGLWDADSSIAVRIFSTRGPVDEAYVRERVTEAYTLRRLVRDRGVTGYRLLFGEADGLPGIVLDVYGAFGILVSYSPSLDALLPLVAKAALEVAGLRGVVRRHKRGEVIELVPLAGDPAPEEVIIEEAGGMRLVAELTRGQKTGLFFDHRDNREFVRSVARGKRVLNLFSYSGGFSVAAALGGATHVTSVDIAEPAIVALSRNFQENGLGDFPRRDVAGDVFDFLEKTRERYDLVICDPPSFAKSRAQLKAAEKAYRRLMSLGLAVTAPGGIFCGASCTSQVSPDGFRRALVDSARKARVRFQVVRDIGHAPDHPVLIGHEEGRYLKFVAGRVLERA